MSLYEIYNIFKWNKLWTIRFTVLKIIPFIGTIIYSFLASLAASYQAVQFLIYGIFILITIFHNFFSPKRLIKKINSHMKLWFGILVQYCTLLSPDLRDFFTYLLEWTRQCLPIYLEDFYASSSTVQILIQWDQFHLAQNYNVLNKI